MAEPLDALPDVGFWQSQGLPPLPPSWSIGHIPSYPEGLRPSATEAAQVKLLLDWMPDAYREDWAKLPRADEELLQAILKVRDYEVPWPPRIAGVIRDWHTRLGGYQK
eukprot:6927071-Alexandrium_andersonii.AAC.1